MNPLQLCLLISAMLFATGFAGAVTRRHAILVLVGIELMLNAANLNLIAFWRYGHHAHPEEMTGFIFVLFSMGLAAAEAAVGLALVISIYRHQKTSNLDEVKELKG